MTSTALGSDVRAQRGRAGGLRAHALGFPPLIAQSVAAISPTMTAVLIIPLAFVDAGRGTWAAYLFATIMLLFVVLGLNQFARRSATAGSMYAYTARGLGPVAGVLSGWTLLWSYLFIAVAGLAGFTIFAEQLLSALGVHGTISPFVLFAISGVTCMTVAWKDIRLSSLLTLTFEGLSVACILTLAAVVLFRHGVTVDTQQLQLKGVSLKGMDFAIVICIFSLVGFESATTLGSEGLNAGARIIYPLGRHGFLPRRANRVHAVNMTPHVAIAGYGAVILAVAVVLHAVGTGPVTIFGDAGTLAAFGFLLAYFLITIAAPFYLRGLGELRVRGVLIAVLAFACLLVPTVGSFYPTPPWPVNLFPYAFLLYMLLGSGWLYILARRQPGVLGMIEADLDQALQASAHAAALSEERHRLDGLGHGVMPGEIAGVALAPE